MKINWTALLSMIAGGGLAGLAPILGSLFPNQATLFTTIFGATGFVALLAGIILQSLMPAAKTTDNAVAVNDKGEVTGKNVTTTTTDPIAAPTSGGVLH